MEVVFDGRINADLSLRQVLENVVAHKPDGKLIVRIACHERQFEGRICIADARFITAADLANSDETGYGALKKLLSVSEGQFACLRPNAGDNVYQVPSLNIELVKIIPLMPELPESPLGLFDEKNLLDKVFNTTNLTPNTAVSVSPSIAAQQDAAIAPGAELSGAWKVVGPVDESLVLGAPNMANLVKDISRSEESPKVRANGSESGHLDLNVEEIRAQVRNDQRTVAMAKVKSAKNAAVSPLLIICIVLLAFGLELLAIVYWKQVSAYLHLKQAPHIVAPHQFHKKFH